MIREIVSRKMQDLYGEEIPVYLKNRIEKELRMMELYGMEDELYALYDLTRGFREKHIPFFLGGEAPASFLLFLLGCSDVDPLPPHYYFEEERKILFDDSAADGFDLPDGPGLRDGHDLNHVLFWGLPESAGKGPKPGISIGVPEDVFVRTRDQMMRDARYDSFEKVDVVKGKGFRCGCLLLSGSMQLPDTDDSWFRPIPAAQLKEYLLTNYLDILKLDRDTDSRPTTFLGVVRIFGLTRGSWARINNQRMRPLNEMEDETCYSLSDFGYSLDTVPAFKDDVFELLCRDGLTEAQAYEEAVRVSIGRGLTEDAAENLYDDPAIPWCNQTIRLFPRAHAIASLIRAYRVHRSRLEQAYQDSEAEKV